MCPLKFYDNEIFGLPYIQSIPNKCPIQDQLPESFCMLKWWRITYVNKTISITLSTRNPNATQESYEYQQTKFDQILPATASEFISIDNTPLIGKITQVLIISDKYQD